MREVYLSLGSNINPEKHIPECLKHLRVHFKVLHESSIYETEPVGPAGNQKFWNLVVSIQTDLNLEALSKDIRKAEEALGRKRDPSNKFAPRMIDIDILPQEGYQQHAFIMVPLAEIAPQKKDLETGKTFEVLAEECKAEHQGLRKIQL